MKQQTLTQYFRPASKQSGSPLQGVREFVEEYKFLTNWESIEHDGWTLPARKEKHCWCGMWKTVGCLNAKVHEKLGKGNRYYIKQFKRSCYRSSCEVCYVKWIARQANVSTRRIEKYSKDTGKKPIHLILCIPPSQFSLPVKLLRKRMNDILKKAEIDGASVIFHPFRFNKKSRRWYYAPHFHLVGFGNSFKIANAFGKYGWFIKICEERQSIFQTFCYILSHGGIKKSYHSVTWVGNLSYSKLKVEKEPKITKCPVCGGEFIEISYNGVHPVVPPDGNYEGLVDADDDWCEVMSYQISSYPEEYLFDYASTKDLNEILKGLILAN